MALKQTTRAVSSYRKAVSLEPGNVALQRKLRLAEGTAFQQRPFVAGNYLLADYINS